MIEPAPELLVMPTSPRRRRTAHRTAKCGTCRAIATAHSDRDPVHGAACGIGLIELLAVDSRSERPFILLGLLLEPTVEQDVAVVHQVLADEAIAIGQTVGEQRTGRVEKEARCADGVTGDDDDVGADLVPGPCCAVDIHRAQRASPAVHGDAFGTAVVPQVDPVAQRLRPVGYPRLAQRTAWAPRHAGDAVVTGGPAVIGRGDDGVVG